MATEIVHCNCQNEGQDKIYGKGNRVANELKKKDTYRCTVCKAIHTQIIHK